MGIRIPKNFNTILRKDDRICSDVIRLCSNAEGPFTLNSVFFPDYTFHGIDHINKALEHADNLIPKKTHSILTPLDIAFLVSAIVIHDLGMFLAEDGVHRLIAGDLRLQRLRGFEDAAWNKAWENYIDRVKRYPQPKMHYLFGKNITPDPDCIKNQAIDSDTNRRVIGEFLRQEHPRLAHEIAVNIFPGNKDLNIFENTTFDKVDRDMVGLLARSHGMAIRDTENYCRDNYEEGPKPCNIPIFYLMAVLRIADLLDAGSHRAPKIRQDIQSIRIPISVEEWTWNQRIIPSKCRWEPKKSRRHIYAEPSTSIEYVQLDQWLSQLQGELDLSWSILSEKYPDEDYRLSIHRITSNIRETSARKKMNENFLTKEAKVSANPEIIKLMMAPLYGDDPSYGVRELLQNAVDACIERKEKEDSSYQGKVTIRLDRESFIIEDNGIGMDENVLLNYYLSAGSSYRNSDEWKQDFTENGESRIARTGRFGVGFLAAFLLGDEITVHTQHINDTKGYLFSFNQDSRPLNIQRSSRCSGTGTTITIRLKEGVFQKLDGYSDHSWYNWYVFDDPVVEYYLEDKPEHVWSKLYRDPRQNRDWFTLDTKNFDSLQWRPEKAYYENRFYCNGIRIHNKIMRFQQQFGLDVPMASVSVVDKNGNLHLDLARSQVLSFPEIDRLIGQIYRYHIARLLMQPWTTEADFYNNLRQGFSLEKSYTASIIPYILSPGGFQLNYESVLSVMGISKYLIIYDTSGNCRQAIEKAYGTIPQDIPIVIAPSLGADTLLGDILHEDDYFYHSPVSFAEGFLSSSLNLFSPYSKTPSPLEDCEYLWAKNTLFQEIHQVYRRNWESVSESSMDPAAIVCFRRSKYTIPDGPPCLIRDPDQIADFPVIFQIATHIHSNTSPADTDARSTFVRTLNEVLVPAPGYPQDLWIPFDLEERKRKYPTAFAELSHFMEAIQQTDSINYFQSRSSYDRTFSKEEYQKKLYALQTKAQAQMLQEASDRKEAAEKEKMIKQHRPDLVALHETLSQSTPAQAASALSSYYAKYAIGFYLQRSADSAPVDIAQELACVLEKIILQENNDDDLTVFINMPLADYLEHDSNTEETIEGFLMGDIADWDLSEELTAELIPIVEELRTIRNTLLASE